MVHTWLGETEVSQVWHSLAQEEDKSIDEEFPASPSY